MMKSQPRHAITTFAAIVVLTTGFLRAKMVHFDSNSLHGERAPVIRLVKGLTTVDSIEHVTGERVSELCDVVFFTKGYAKQYPSVHQHAKQLILVEDILLESSVRLISSSRTFFLKIDWAKFFVDQVVPLISKDFILVTHRSDITAGNVPQLLANPRLIRWYGCNMMSHEKTKSLPLGLEDTDMWGRTNIEVIERERNNHKTELLHVFFNIKTNVGVRQPALDALNRNGFKMRSHQSWPKYITELSEHKFCASPEGNGFDTHRMWECLYLGVIPVVLENPVLQDWYSDLPILWVSSYDQVTPQFLRSVKIESSKSTHDKVIPRSLFSISRIRDALASEL